jgi:peptidoglycan/LPS O-acetylase OafA/YrhL
VIEALAWGAVVVAYLHTSLTPGQLGSRLLSRLGEVSYSIYVVHLLVLWSVWRFLEKFTFVDDPWWNALLNGVLVVLPLTCALSFATYRLVERPFLRMRRHYLIPIAPAQPAGPPESQPRPVTAQPVAAP